MEESKTRRIKKILKNTIQDLQIPLKASSEDLKQDKTVENMLKSINRVIKELQKIIRILVADKQAEKEKIQSEILKKLNTLKKKLESKKKKQKENSEKKILKSKINQKISDFLENFEPLKPKMLSTGRGLSCQTDTTTIFPPLEKVDDFFERKDIEPLTEEILDRRYEKKIEDQKRLENEKLKAEMEKEFEKKIKIQIEEVDSSLRFKQKVEFLRVNDMGNFYLVKNVKNEVLIFEVKNKKEGENDKKIFKFMGKKPISKKIKFFLKFLFPKNIFSKFIFKKEELLTQSISTIVSLF